MGRGGEADKDGSAPRRVVFVEGGRAAGGGSDRGLVGNPAERNGGEGEPSRRWALSDHGGISRGWPGGRGREEPPRSRTAFPREQSAAIVWAPLKSARGGFLAGVVSEPNEDCCFRTLWVWLSEGLS